MSKKRWNKKNPAVLFLGKILSFIFGKYKTYSWKKKSLNSKALLPKLLIRDTLATITYEIRGFGEWRKLVFLRKRGKRCSNCNKSWYEESLEFHHKKPLKAVQKAFFETPLKILPNFIIVMLANIIANRIGNMELLCLSCHYEAHVYLSRNGHTKGAERLIEFKLKKRGKPVPRV